MNTFFTTTNGSHYKMANNSEEALLFKELYIEVCVEYKDGEEIPLKDLTRIKCSDIVKVEWEKE